MKKDSPYLFGKKQEYPIKVHIYSYISQPDCATVYVSVPGHAFHHIQAIVETMINPNWFVMYHEHNNRLELAIDEMSGLIEYTN
jgi:hypothetical protein